MKHILKASLLILVLMFSQTTLSHGDHQSINGQDATMIASKTIKQMTFKNLGFDVGQLPKEWKNISYDNISIINLVEGHYIVKASLSDNDHIYLQISPSGQVVNATEENTF